MAMSVLEFSARWRRQSGEREKSKKTRSSLFEYRRTAMGVAALGTVVGASLKLESVGCDSISN